MLKTVLLDSKVPNRSTKDNISLPAFLRSNHDNSQLLWI